ncbi:hypothetical protein GCM10010499_09700 [Streptomyces thermoviolaceus subsp. apingens]|nr:hypothetical protein GCM10010499_09700 [Streptomyces thermoviolaceus subsp. apingens]
MPAIRPDIAWMIWRSDMEVGACSDAGGMEEGACSGAGGEVTAALSAKSRKVDRSGRSVGRP